LLFYFGNICFHTLEKYNIHSIYWCKLVYLASNLTRIIFTCQVFYTRLGAKNVLREDFFYRPICLQNVITNNTIENGHIFNDLMPEIDIILDNDSKLLKIIEIFKG
jgi:hypothetical protein